MFAETQEKKRLRDIFFTGFKQKNYLEQPFVKMLEKSYCSCHVLQEESSQIVMKFRHSPEKAKANKETTISFPSLKKSKKLQTKQNVSKTAEEISTGHHRTQFELGRAFQTLPPMLKEQA